MHRHVLTAILIMVAGSAAAVLTNLTWHKMDWLRRPIAPPMTQERTTQPIDSGDTSVGQPAPPPGMIAIDEVLADLAAGSAHFIDAREEHDYVEGHIRGAILLPSSAIYERIDEVYGAGVSPEGKVIVYCGGGDCEASHNVADELRRSFGFTNVLVYNNGWAEVETSGRFGEFISVGAEP